MRRVLLVGSPPATGRPSRWWYALLVVPFAALLYPPLDAREDPTLGGFPFFSWDQLVWAPVTACLA